MATRDRDLKPMIPGLAAAAIWPLLAAAGVALLLRSLAGGDAVSWSGLANLMVVLVSDRGAQPVVNSGSLYT
jgi:hypothetical protein